MVVVTTGITCVGQKKNLGLRSVDFRTELVEISQDFDNVRKGNNFSYEPALQQGSDLSCFFIYSFMHFEWSFVL